MEDGEITVDFTESKAVIRIFEEYLNGSSLMQIAKLMESEKIKYSEDSDRWNKNMVKRIIENEKYLGTDKYPQIISEKFFDQTNKKEHQKQHLSALYPRIYKRSEAVHTALNAVTNYPESEETAAVQNGIAEILNVTNLNISLLIR